MEKIRPIISEKTVALAKKGHFAIEVSSKSSKSEIAQKLREIFNLHPINVNISNKKSQKAKKMKGFSRSKSVKKAYVTLAKGEKFPGFEIAFEDDKAKKKGEKNEVKK